MATTTILFSGTSVIDNVRKPIEKIEAIGFIPLRVTVGMRSNRLKCTVDFDCKSICSNQALVSVPIERRIEFALRGGKNDEFSHVNPDAAGRNLALLPTAERPSGQLRILPSGV